MKLIALLLLLSFALPALAAEFPAPKAPADPSAYGLHLQRTMTLLATSTPEHRNKVRILFYGQSITGQGWWKFVEADLRRRFPNADAGACRGIHAAATPAILAAG